MEAPQNPAPLSEPLLISAAGALGNEVKHGGLVGAYASGGGKRKHHKKSRKEGAKISSKKRSKRAIQSSIESAPGIAPPVFDEAPLLAQKICPTLWTDSREAFWESKAAS